MSTTRIAIRQAAGLQTGWMSTGTFTAVDTTTADDSARHDDDAIHNGGFLNVTTTAYLQERRINTWAQATNRFTIYGSFSPALAVGNAYEVWRFLSAAQVNQCILEAIRMAAPYIYQNLSNASLTITGGTYTVTVPATFKNYGVHRVEVLDPGSGTPLHIVTGWRYRGDGTTLELPQGIVDSYAGHTLRLHGVGHVTEPSADTGTVELDEPEVNIVILGTKVRMIEKRMLAEPIQSQEKYLQILRFAAADYERATRLYGKRPDFQGPPQHNPWA